MSYTTLCLLFFVGVALSEHLDNHYSDIIHMILRGQSPHAQYQIKQLLSDEMLSRQERNQKMRKWADDHNAESSLKWFLEKEREYEHHNMEVQGRRPHDISRASRAIRKVAKCPHSTEREKMYEVPEEVASFSPELQHTLRTLYPSLHPLNLVQLRHELESAPFQEIEDKNAELINIAYSYNRSPIQKRSLIEKEIETSRPAVAYVLQNVLWPRIPGVHPIVLNKRRRRSHPKDLH